MQVERHHKMLVESFIVCQNKQTALQVTSAITREETRRVCLIRNAAVFDTQYVLRALTEKVEGRDRVFRHLQRQGDPTQPRRTWAQVADA